MNQIMRPTKPSFLQVLRTLLQKNSGLNTIIEDNEINYSKNIISASGSFISINNNEINNQDFPIDTYICYNKHDMEIIECIVKKLKENNINYWLDTEYPKGVPPVRQIQDALNQCRTGSVFISPFGIGEFQQREIGVFYQKPQKDMPVIVLLLPGQEEIPQNEPFLKNYGLPIMVDFNSNLWVQEWLFALTGKQHYQKKSI